ncbi:MAG: S-layer homology domain-containing protein, partial [Maioricimonas sp. JB049]
NSDGGSHCTDAYDRMCTGHAASSRPLVCTNPNFLFLLDCNGDDYFHPSRQLKDQSGKPYWNTADSVFLTSRMPGWWEAVPTVIEPFGDSLGSPFVDDITQLVKSGITKGCNPPDNTKFCPSSPVTRGQMATFLVRALNLPAASSSFSDVSPTYPHRNDIAALAAAGITKGCNPPDNTKFCPDESVTRGQMAAFLNRAGLAG